MTLRFAVNDVLTILRQKYDDSKISFPQALFHTLSIANRLKLQHIEKRDTGSYIHVYNQVPVLKEDDTNKKYIELPDIIFDMDRDRGINYISYDYLADDCGIPFTSITFSRTTHATSKRLYWTEEEKPATDNPYFIVQKGKVLLLGIENIDVNNVEVGLYSAFNIQDYFDGLKTLDEEWDFPEELYEILQRRVLDVGRFVLLMPREITNEGGNELEAQQSTPKTKMVSVNDVSAEQINE